MKSKRKVQKPKSLITRINRAIKAQVETKTVSLTDNAAAGSVDSSYTPAMVSLCQIAQGDNINDRTGNVIDVQRIQIKNAYTITAATVQTLCRTLIIRMRQQINNTIPVITNILAVTGSDMAPCSPMSTGPESNKYFEILYDKLHVLSVQGAPMIVESINIYPKNRVHYTGAGALDYGKDSIFMVLMSNQVNGAGASPYVNSGWQVWYKDP